MVGWKSARQEMIDLGTRRRYLLPIIAGAGGSLLLSGIYFGIVSLAESPAHSAELFWQDRWIVLPILAGFGVQVGLYVILKKKLFFPVKDTGPRGALTGAGGGLSATAMAACCAHHVTDVLPLAGLTAAATFLAQYQLFFIGWVWRPRFWASSSCWRS